MKKLACIFGAIMFLIPAVAGAQALPFTAIDSDAKSLSKAGADLIQTSPAAIPYSDATDQRVSPSFTVYISIFPLPLMYTMQNLPDMFLFFGCCRCAVNRYCPQDFLLFLAV